ncbi:MAG: toll/interleukin-1 receptor domain-containing protein [Acidimicrobiia bacterium]
MGPSTDDLLTPPWEQDARGVSAADREQGDEFDFFISYAGEDLEIARRIADDLRGQGDAIRFQQRDFGVGQNFHRQIDDVPGSAVSLDRAERGAYRVEGPTQPERMAR